MASVQTTTATSDLFAAFTRTPAVQSLRQRVERGGALSYDGVSPAAQPFLAALLRHLFPQRPIVVVTEGVKAQESFQQDIETWFKVRERSLPVDATSPTAKGSPAGVAHRSTLLFYPPWEILPHEAKLPHADVISERLETLVALTLHEPGSTGVSPAAGWAQTRRRDAGAPRPEARNSSGNSHHTSPITEHAPLIVTSVPALLQRTFAPESLRARVRQLERGQRIDPLDLVEWLEDQGYEPEAQVNHKGEIALRGGILDLFPLTSPWPVRLEFFGDELESLRYFDPITQLSKEEVARVTLPPGGELGLLKKQSEIRGPEGPESLATLAQYVPDDAIFLLCEAEAIAEQAEDYAALVPENDPFFISWADFQTQLQTRGHTTIAVGESPEPPAEIEDSIGPSPSTLRPPQFQSLDAFRPIIERMPDPQVAETQRREFFSQLHRWLRQGYAVHLFCNNDGERQRFVEVWKEYGFDGRVSGPMSVVSGQWSVVSRPPAEPSVSQLRTTDYELQTHLGALTRGFLCEEGQLVVVTDAEIFGRYKVPRPRRLKSPHAPTSRSLLDIDFTELEEGDYVVHLHHGIGRYLGLQVLPAAGGEKPLEKASLAQRAGQECLVIEYAPSDPDQPPPKLYVPVNEAHLISKYVGVGKARPSLHTLGGVRWTKAKEQAERAVRDLAAELLSIQAAREAMPGHAFALDMPWQREFESAFLYEETPDQMRAILDAKSDMERPKPMDRLICGDVGYGKTEVAIRAAFKAVLGGKQVAILVPTTVLAQQHFNTFRERMADYPVRIELLSRFRTPGEQKKVVKALAEGTVDIVIGTHRLIQEDIAFKDLGLVVIDEEQRFGVIHKEKFKLLRQLVDVLTLSATPIPRTLYLALTGARDMSTIETPPQDRLPVETIVAQYGERLIRDAIQRELSRGGQVFYLHNRVFDIESVAAHLRTLLPKARIVVGHGQMHADELEEVMTRFVNGEADVLLSTTIIESGLDIPNANTIIIDRADRFGLSDLYQLRGRVGRYKHQAYAYLLIPRHARMLTDARKRISAIKQYSTLGSGFKIAMRDLEIRGAGNLLGPQQSGHITAVGFDLYCQLLKQSIGTLKGEKVQPRVAVEVRLDFLRLDAVEASRPKAAVRKQEEKWDIPREVATYANLPSAADQAPPRVPRATPIGHAYIPVNYIVEPRQRIEIYRKLAEITDATTLDRLRDELRDRFGLCPPPVELLLLLAEIRLLAAAQRITCIETKDDKLMLTRNSDAIMLGGRFPRLTKPTVKARLGEIKQLLKTLK